MATASIPQVFIAPLRAALAAQGFPRETIGDNGVLNPAGLLAGSYDSLELRSAITPTFRIDTKALLSDGPRNPILDAVKPTVILTGPAGTNVIAPYGPAAAGGWVVPVFFVGLLVGIGVVIGRATA